MTALVRASKLTFFLVLACSYPFSNVLRAQDVKASKTPQGGSPVTGGTGDSGGSDTKSAPSPAAAKPGKSTGANGPTAGASPDAGRKTPKKPGSTVVQNAVNKQAPSSEAGVIDCNDFLLTPAPDAGVFSSNGRFYYFMTHKQGSAAAVNHRVVVRVDLETGEVEELLEADVNSRGVLIAHGTKLSAVTYMGFKDQALACARGHGLGYTIVLGSKAKLVRSFLANEYQVVATDLDRAIVDLSSGIIKEIDPVSLQMRKGSPLKKNRYYLYVDQKSKRFYSLDIEKGRVLERYQLFTDALEAKLPMEQGDWLIQQGEYFAIARYVADKNAIEITENPDWGRRVAGHKLTLPSAYKVQDASLLVDFGSRTALVFRRAKNKYAQKWDRVMIWNLEKDEVISNRLIKDKTYLAHAALAPGARKYIVVTQNSANDTPAQILSFDIEKQEWVWLK